MSHDSVFEQWQVSCSDPSKDKEDCRRESRQHFYDIISSSASGDDGSKHGRSRQFLLRSTDAVAKPNADSEGALARLIKKLGPSFAETATMKERLLALYYMMGAVEASRQHCLSEATVTLLGRFFLEYCGPIQKQQSAAVNVDDPSSASGIMQDYEEQVRDAAVMGLTHLLLCPVTNTGKYSGDSMMAPYEQRVELAKNGVEKRCAQPKTEKKLENGAAAATTNGDNKGNKEATAAAPPPPPTPQEQQKEFSLGLAGLARSRRSRCFDLVRAGIDSINHVAALHPLEKTQAKKLAGKAFKSFATFSASCLHGESDPRCLMQLLKLLLALLKTLEPIYELAESSDFPIKDIFEACAPYYPILFEPPPNDTHGITREGLRKALMDVLFFFGLDHVIAHGKKETMLQLTLGLLLERLVPTDDDEPVTRSDQLEAMHEINVLALAPHEKSKSNVSKFHPAELHKVSDVLTKVHYDASVEAVRAGPNAALARELADLCRHTVAKIAWETELASKRPMLHKAFVSDALHSLQSKLAPGVSSPEGRSAIAYMACLTSSGGPGTLVQGLAVGLPPLLDMLAVDKVTANGKTSTNSQADISTALFGIGAFFSSCRAAIDKAGKDGISFHPHPLNDYAGRAVDVVTVYTANTHEKVIRAAAVRAMDAILVASPGKMLNEARLKKVDKFFKTMAETIMESVDETKKGDAEEDFLEACCQALGAAMGRVKGYNKDEVDSKVLVTATETEQVQAFMNDEIFSDLCHSVSKAAKSLDSKRHDRKTLAIATKHSIYAASKIIGPLMDKLYAAVKNKEDQNAIRYAEAMSLLFEVGGLNAARAYQDNPLSEYVTGEELLDAMGSLPQIVRVPDSARISMSELALPPTEEENEAFQRLIVLADSMIPLLIKAYDYPVTKQHVQRIVKDAEGLLPPLDQQDMLKLSMRLPHMARALLLLEEPRESGVAEKLEQLLPEMISIVFVPDYHPTARSYATQFVFATLFRFSTLDTDECPVLQLILQDVMPVMVSATEDEEREGATADQLVKAVLVFCDCLGMLGVLGAAAACRGGLSAATADMIVSFLVELACYKSARSPFTNGQASDEQMLFNLTVFDRDDVPDESNMLASAAASAFGTILSTEIGNTLWKQRFAHAVARMLHERAKRKTSIKENAKEAEEIKELGASPSLGLLAIVCHTVCANSMHIIGSHNVDVFADVVLRGLGSSSLLKDSEGEAPVLKLVIAALVKLLCVMPQKLSKYITIAAVGAMRAYAMAGGTNRGTDMACKMMALQALETIATRDDFAGPARQQLKPAVIAVLAPAMNHPSSFLRQAAVEVRNAWYLMD